MPPLDIHELERLIAIMRKMHQEAEKADWQALARLDDERRALIQYDVAKRSLSDEPLLATLSFSNPGNAQNADKLVHSRKDEQYELMIAEIRKLDRQIISGVQAAREALLVQNRDLSAQVKAKQLYAQTSSMT